MNKKKIINVLKIVVLSAIIGLYLFKFLSPVVPYRISGQSMNPTLNDGQFVWIDKTAYKKESPKRGDIVVFHPNFFQTYVKRVIAVPGDRIRMCKGYVFVNSVRVDEDYVPELAENAGILKNEITLGEDEYICLGDNRNNSYDSREIGVVNIRKFVGRVKE